MSDHNNLPLTLLGDLNSVAEVSDTTVNLDFVVEEFLECADIEDLVRGRLGRVDDELNPRTFSLLNPFVNIKGDRKKTFLPSASPSLAFLPSCPWQRISISQNKHSAY